MFSIGNVSIDVGPDADHLATPFVNAWVEWDKSTSTVTVKKLVAGQWTDVAVYSDAAYHLAESTTMVMEWAATNPDGHPVIVRTRSPVTSCCTG